MERDLNERDKVGIQDAVLIEDYTNQDAFVENLNKRYSENLIYTYIGQVLVSVNPYKELNIYSPEYVKDYENRNYFEVPPHIFALTDTAFRSLKSENRDQCILISGESGSGKTEASKKVLQYIATVTGNKGQVEQVKNKLLQSNPVLEAFGNARTNRNDNSSRFGKYMDIEFDFEGNPAGGNILNYLLEKSRVINQVQGERNFHIFHQLLAGADDQQLAELRLQRNQHNYAYLSQGDLTNSYQTKDANAFKDVQKALNTIEISRNEQDDMFKIIAGILLMGNVTFSEMDGRAYVTEHCKDLESISMLLGCDAKQLSDAYTHRTREANGDVVTSPLDKETAIYARDALSKAIYDRLFTWLVGRINQSIKSTQGDSNRVMGILDIYGFEIFQKNNYEQFCINFCNEKLQQLFIDLTLKSEQEEYEREGIEWTNIDYFDNKDICDLIEAKHAGIIAFMDEECLRPGDTTDLTLLAKMNQHLSHHKHYLSHQKADIKLQKTMGRDEFQLNHYAGDVTYNIRAFIEKNNDLLFRDLREVMLSCTANTIITACFNPEEQRSIKRPDTVITQFKNSVNDLINILKNKHPTYIRCIKPNDGQRPAHFDHDLVNHQVTYLGLMENLRVRRAGFAYRRSYDMFVDRYKCLTKETWPRPRCSPKEAAQIIACKMGYEGNEYKLGKTKIFIKNPKTLFETEDAFQLKKHDLATMIKAHYKGYKQRKEYEKQKNGAIFLQKYIRMWRAKKEVARRRQAVQAIRNFIEGFMTRNGPETNINKKFVASAKRQWLLRLAKNLPKNFRDKSWPTCPDTCKEASEQLRVMYKAQQVRLYKARLDPKLKAQLELKVLAEQLFVINGDKKYFERTIPMWFKNQRVPKEMQETYDRFISSLHGEKVRYSTVCKKYDRHGYKERNRMIIATNRAIHVLKLKETDVTKKHRFPLDAVKLLVTDKSDGMLMIQLPDNLIQTDKGDIIFEVNQLVECVTQIVAIDGKAQRLNIVAKEVIEHKMKDGQGVIDVTEGTPARIHKEKSTGHLLITASP